MPTLSDRNLPIDSEKCALSAHQLQSSATLSLKLAKKEMVGGTHYLDMGIQPWDVIDTWTQEQRIGFHRGNSLKYLMRLGSKDEQLQEAKKARHYIDKLIEVLSE
jgi:hypothetical protein